MSSGLLRFSTVAACAAVLFVMLVGGPAYGGPREDQAREFIDGLADKAINALADKSATDEEREARLRVLLDENFAVDDIGEWVLGRYWRRATPEEREEYLKLFEEMIITTYVRRFKNYSGEALEVGRAFLSSDDGDIIVDSRIVRPNAVENESINVGWRVRSYEDGPKIVDVILEGVSMGQTQRSEFASVIMHHGGTVAGLIDVLRDKVKDGQ